MLVIKTRLRLLCVATVYKIKNEIFFLDTLRDPYPRATPQEAKKANYP